MHFTSWRPEILCKFAGFAGKPGERFGYFLHWSATKTLAQFTFSAGMSKREVVQLQFGTYSNFVSAHFWNLEVRSFPP